MEKTTAKAFFTLGVVLTLLPSLRTSMGADPIKRSDPMRAREYFNRRAGEEKAKAVRETGATKKSEAAVAAALKWLAAHQLPDGGWNFDHRAVALCGGRCSHAGSLVAPNAATSMALLCFLGAGQSHLDGDYKAVVSKGLNFLVERGEKSDRGLSFHEPGGSMYSHGLAALALAEAYGMTKDRKIFEPAQEAINFIVKSQDPVGGGWRYMPLQAGDMSVTGWQFSALTTAKDASLEVPAATFKHAEKFLSACSPDGAFYGYTGPGRGRATTAIGLLCQMYGGWEHDAAPLKRGVDWLAESGPSAAGERAAWYYNFYGTQVLWQYGGAKWNAWNSKLCDFLIETQESDGHAEGSWFVGGDHGAERGGRLYCTALATLILEAHYRNKPIYTRE